MEVSFYMEKKSFTDHKETERRAPGDMEFVPSILG